MDTVEFFSKISIPLSFTAECAENAEASEKNELGLKRSCLKLCALGDKSLLFRQCPRYVCMYASANLAIPQQRLEKIG